MATANPAIPGGLAGLTRLKELRQRLLFVLFAMVVYRICTHVPVPGINPLVLEDFFNQQSGTILDLFNMFSGGATSFVNKGTNKRWKDTLGKTDCEVYEARAILELGPECAHWLATGVMPGG